MQVLRRMHPSHVVFSYRTTPNQDFIVTAFSAGLRAGSAGLQMVSLQICGLPSDSGIALQNCLNAMSSFRPIVIVAASFPIINSD